MNNNNLSFLDILTILSFVIGLYALLIGLENLEENRQQNRDSEEILYQLENHLKNQDEHLKQQDKLLGKEA